ncbi:MAG: serine/threonine-protein kinase [Kofleriaceae bacterium]
MNEGPTTFDSVLKAVARVPSTAPLFQVGQLLDDTYELVERIGGGMGVVYRARDKKLGRDVAVKTLTATSDPDLLRLFEREARATAQLLHPNIVTLHHVGSHEAVPYLVLELLVGETLDKRLARRQKLSVGEALAIIEPVLAAISFAHERGVLHRDLKPSNVFLTVDERVKVLDFGVALALDSSPGAVTIAAGTPGYMAPEQREGLVQDPRTDLWSAALLMLECLVGRRLSEPELPAALREIEASSSVRTVLGAALSAEPDKRPSSAAELRRQLVAAHGGVRDTAKAKRKQRVVLAAVATASLVAGGAVAYLLVPRGQSARDPITPAELSGRAWHVNYGQMRLHVEDNGTFYGVYDQGNGVLVGTYANDRFVGRWCQEPTRMGPEDAGRVELHFVRGDKRILIEGVWTYGDGRAAAWQDNFYGVSLETPTPYQLEKRLQHHQGCPGH